MVNLALGSPQIHGVHGDYLLNFLVGLFHYYNSKFSRITRNFYRIKAKKGD